MGQADEDHTLAEEGVLALEMPQSDRRDGESVLVRQLEVPPGLGDALGDAPSVLVEGPQAMERVAVALSCASLVVLEGAPVTLRDAQSVVVGKPEAALRTYWPCGAAML